MEEELQNQQKKKLTPEVINLLEDRINFKLSLRKKKYNEFFTKRRIIQPKSNISSRPYELFLSTLKLPSSYKLIFSKDDELISTALNSIKSDDVSEVLYGVCLLKSYITHFLDDDILTQNLNLNFISDLLNLLEKWCEKRELKIIYNTLYIITNYSYANENKLISKILLSSKGYKIWELCFNLQDYEIMSQMVWILQNITYEDKEGSYNLLKSNFFKNNILSFYSNQNIVSHLNEKDPENIFHIIIECGLGLLSNLISVEYPSSYDTKERYKLALPVFNLILKYADSNSEKIYHSCIYSICLAIDEEPDLIESLDNTNIINDILNKKFFSNESLVLYANRIIGNYTANKSKLSDEFYNKCIQYEFDIYFGIKNPLAVKETFWVLSNILKDYQNAGLIICNNEPFINQTIYRYQNIVELSEIHELAYFFHSLICKCGIQNFIKLQGKGLLDITMKHAKVTFEQPKKLVTIFRFIEECLFIGDSVRDNFMGKNLIKEKCDELGLKDLLEKYENTENIELYEIIEKINNTYYKDDNLFEY